ncbi:hypothetical protein N9H10_05335, partial [Luminiphilus sp.]
MSDKRIATTLGHERHGHGHAAADNHHPPKPKVTSNQAHPGVGAPVTIDSGISLAPSLPITEREDRAS